MLPYDVACSAIGQGSNNSRGLLAPGRFFQTPGRIAAGAVRPVGHGVSNQHGGHAGSSQPRPIPSKHRTRATCTVEAPAAPSENIAAPINFGYDCNIDSKYDWGKEVGKGGNGVVHIVVDRATGQEYACKAIRKVLQGDFSDKKKAGHVDSVKQEIEVLRKLSGSLNIVKLVDVFEDEQNVFVVQELCKGGELWHRIGEKHYSERTVASFMRAVLRTLAQCHSHHILHRDIKPGNFMLLDDSERSPLKAIDFGLAMPYNPDNLPMKDLGLEGTPWYMAPEVLSSNVTPASDVWSAGVMAFQLLTGRLPFDDHRNPFAPSISAVWRSVLCDQVDYNMPWWRGISDEGKDFVNSLLQRNPDKRPSAKEALKHPWLQGNSSERSMGKQLDVSVVARIQRFAQNNRFKRSVLRLIAEELLSRPGAMAAESALASESSFRGGITAISSASNPIIQDPNSKQMQDIYKKLELTGDAIDRDTAAVALAKMGYKLEPSEIGRLLEQVDVSNSGKVRRAALAASQIDWRYLQQNRMSDWLHIAHRTFASLDKDSDGVLDVNDIITSLKAKLPPDELRLTVQQAMQEAGVEKDSDHMDFEGFLRMLKVGSVDSLDQYDARWDRPGASPSVGSIDRLQSLLDVSQHGSDGGSTCDRGLYAGVNNAVPAGALATSAVSVYPSDQFKDYKDKSWNKPMVNFKFDFGNEFIGHKVNKADGGYSGPPKTRGAPAPDFPVPPPSSTAATPALNPALTRSNSLFAATGGGDSRVRGGTHFDKRMHGASLYRNAMLAPAGASAPSRPVALPTVRE